MNAEPNKPETRDDDETAGADVPPPDLSVAAPGREDLSDDAAVADPPAGDAPTAKLEAEVAELKDRLLRAMAEVENTRRIASRETEKASKYAIAAFAREMLSVADNMDRALQSIPEDARKESPAMETLYVGVDLTRNEMTAAFDRAGIRLIEADGAPFNPALHEAMFEVPNPDVPEGTVVQVLRSGYVLGDRLLRPAQVGVAKGGPKAERAARESGTPGADGHGYEASDEGPGAAQKGGKLDERT